MNPCNYIFHIDILLAQNQSRKICSCKIINSLEQASTAFPCWGMGKLFNLFTLNLSVLFTI